MINGSTLSGAIGTGSGTNMYLSVGTGGVTTVSYCYLYASGLEGIAFFGLEG